MNCIWRKTVFMVSAVVVVPFVGCEYSSSVKWGDSPTNNVTRYTSQEESSADLRAEGPVVRIDSPREGDVIYDDVYHGMAGAAYDVPQNKRLVVFASDNYRYFLTYPFPRKGRTTNTFEQKNVRLATGSDEWQLHVCLATHSAAATLSSCARRGEWSFPELPAGVDVVKSIHVERRIR